MASCKNAIELIISRYHKIDGIVNNAGLNDGVGLEEGNYEKFVASLEKNVAHYFSMVKLSLPYLKKSEGVIINICSKVALTGQGGTSGYAAANGERFELTNQNPIQLMVNF